MNSVKIHAFLKPAGKGTICEEEGSALKGKGSSTVNKLVIFIRCLKCLEKVEMTHLISAKSRERSALWVPTLDPLGATPSCKCQPAGPWQPPLPSARNSVTSSAEKTLTAPQDGSSRRFRTHLLGCGKSLEVFSDLREEGEIPHHPQAKTEGERDWSAPPSFPFTRYTAFLARVAHVP